MQISPRRPPSHGCSATIGEALKDGAANLYCAVEISGPTWPGRRGCGQGQPRRRARMVAVPQGEIPPRDAGLAEGPKLLPLIAARPRAGIRADSGARFLAQKTPMSRKPGFLLHASASRIISGRVERFGSHPSSSRPGPSLKPAPPHRPRGAGLHHRNRRLVTLRAASLRAPKSRGRCPG